MKASALRANSYIISSNPAEVAYGQGKNINTKYYHFAAKSTLQHCRMGITPYNFIQPFPIVMCMLLSSFTDGNLYVRYRSPSGVWKSSLSGLEEGKWYTIDISWDHENGMTVYVNNVQRAWLQVS